MGRRTILVCGATGRLGQLADLLIGRGHRVRATTRHPDSPRAQALARLGAQLVRADFEDRDSVLAAARGADAVFAAGTFHAAGPQADLRHGRTIAEATYAAGAHLVYLSVAGAQQPAGVPALESKHAVQTHISRLGGPSTILAPVYFMENVWNPWNRAALSAGRLPSPVPATRRLQQISIGDVLAFCTLAMEQPAHFLGQHVELAADELTGQQSAQALAQILARGVELVAPFPDPPNPLFAWLDRVGTHVDIPALRGDYPQIPWHDYRSWAASQDWAALTPRRQ
jgi:uncharacterized protein YbjT (DUF2867 family)